MIARLIFDGAVELNLYEEQHGVLDIINIQQAPRSNGIYVWYRKDEEQDT